MDIQKNTMNNNISFLRIRPCDNDNEIYLNSRKKEGTSTFLIKNDVPVNTENLHNKEFHTVSKDVTINSDVWMVIDENRKEFKSINPKIEFSSDFIIGYPGEDEEDFEATYDLIRKIKFINSFSFIFSPRPGTAASTLKPIDRKISLARLEKVQNLLFENQIKMNKTLEKKEIDVLVENKIDGVILTNTTDKNRENLNGKMK